MEIKRESIPGIMWLHADHLLTNIPAHRNLKCAFTE